MTIKRSLRNDIIHRNRFRGNNRETKNEKSREYYNEKSETICAKNRRRYNEITSVKMTCNVCGTVHNKKNKPLHLRSKKHQEALNNSKQY